MFLLLLLLLLLQSLLLLARRRIMTTNHSWHAYKAIRRQYLPANNIVLSTISFFPRTLALDSTSVVCTRFGSNQLGSVRLASAAPTHIYSGAAAAARENLWPKPIDTEREQKSESKRESTCVKGEEREIEKAPLSYPSAARRFALNIASSGLLFQAFPHSSLTILHEILRSVRTEFFCCKCIQWPMARLLCVARGGFNFFDRSVFLRLRQPNPARWPVDSDVYKYMTVYDSVLKCTASLLLCD